MTKRATTDVAAEYVARGWAPIPVPYGEKKPSLPGWQKLRIADADLAEHFNGEGNVGVLLGEPSGWLIDIDLDHPDALELADKHLPPTSAVFGRESKPRSHRLYNVTAAVKTKKFTGPDKSMLLELRSTGCHTLFPESVHPSGESIRWDDDGNLAKVGVDELLEAAESLADAVRARLASPPPADVMSSPPVARAPGDDTDGAITRAAKYLDAMPPAISGSGGHNQTYAAATALVHGFRLDPDTAFRLLWDRYNTRCVPPWLERDLRHKVEDAATKPHDRPAGWLLDAPPSAAVRVEDGAGPADICDLVEQFPDLRPPILDGLLRRGELMNLVAPPKRGKSWLVASLAVSVAAGRRWLSRFDVVDPGPVLVLDNELHPETMSHRIPRVSSELGVGIGELRGRLFVETMRGGVVTVEQVLRQAAWARAKDVRVVVVDALYRLATSGTSENDNSAMASLYGKMDHLASESGAAVVLVHHSSKGAQGDKDVTDVGAGAGSQARAADVHAVLRDHQEPGCVVLDAAMRSWKPLEPLCLRWRYPAWQIDPELDPTLLKGRTGTRTAREPKPKFVVMELGEFVAAFVGTTPKGRVSIRNAAIKAGLSGRDAAEQLKEAVEEGLVQKLQKGRNAPAMYCTKPVQASAKPKTRKKPA